MLSYSHVTRYLETMSRSTRSQTAANVRFQANLASVIHRLPNEVIAHIFVSGCPTPNHKLKHIDVAPLEHQMLVGSICKLWRNIAHDCPTLWTSVVVRCPLSRNKPSRNKLKFYEDIIGSVLRRSRTLEVDLSLRIDYVPEFWQSDPPYYRQVAPHLQRVQTLDVERRDQFMDWLLRTKIPRLPKLRHFYTKGCQTSGGPSIFPFCIVHNPLETFYYEVPYHLPFDIIPTSRLRYVHIGMLCIERKLVDFVSGCSNLQVLELYGTDWHRDAIISSSTLTHLDLRAWQLGEFPTKLWDGLPNLLHLHLRAEYVDISRQPFISRSWASLPLLRSLSIHPRKKESQLTPTAPHLTDILRCAPQLIALRLAEVDALEAIEFFRTYRGDELRGSIGRKPLQLLQLITTHEQIQGRWGDLVTIAPILRRWDPEETEWHSEKCVNPIIIDGVKIELCADGVELSPPLSVRADEIADEDIQGLSEVTILHADR
jgi:hypothetical protein